MEFFDSHTHLNHSAFDDDRDEVWEQAKQAGVTRAVVIGWDLESSRAAISMADRHTELSAAVGVSPHDAAEAPEGYLDRVREMTRHPKVVAIGEIGLEYQHPVGPKETQRQVFREQLDLAAELDLPVVIHNRNADADLLGDLCDHPPPGGVLHCFTSDVEMMQSGIERGLHISLSGIVTFKMMGGMGEVARAIPDERLVIETDCPYIAPTPFRGQRCEPSMIEQTLRVIAECRGVTPQELASVTYANATRLFKLPNTAAPAPHN